MYESNTKIKDAIQLIADETIRDQAVINDLSANNESQKNQILIMRYRNESYEAAIDNTILFMLASIIINFLTIGWIVYSAF